MRLFFLFVLIIISFNTFSQVGKDCSNPNVISALPFSAVGLTTNGFVNDYTIPCPSCPATTYMSGFDYVFKYTPSSDITISITLSNITALGTATSVGMYLCDGCPDNSSTSCIGLSENSSTPRILNKTLLANNDYYIIIDTWAYGILNQYTGFDINIFESHVIDIGGIMLYEPRSSCNLSNERFVYQFKNWGQDTAFNIPLGYQVDNNPPVYETLNDFVLPNQEFYYTFLTQSDLSSPNTTYQIKIFSDMPGDENQLNDTIFFPITNNDVVNTFPYFEDFESYNNMWTSAWIGHTAPGTSWQRGNPSKPIINHAASGTKCWVTDSVGTVQYNESSYVISPCFDFSLLTLPLLEMDIWYETNSSDIILVEYTTDNTPGQNINWHRLGNNGEGQNWYNYTYQQNSAWNGSSGSWIHSLHTLDSLAGKPYAKLRITFRGGLNGLSEGFAFDNIRISESPMSDLSVSKIIYPVNNCNLSSNDSVSIVIKNHGLNSQTDFAVKCSIDGGLNYVTDTVHDVLNFQDTMIYTFLNPFNFSNPGLYDVISTVALSGDLNTANDTSRKNVMSYPTISTYPHIEDFESNNGYWYTYGLNSSWEWGTPNDSILTSAFSGQKCWATNLSGYHNLAEESYVESPCFDLSQYKNPELKMAVWYDEFMSTTCQLDTLRGSTFNNMDNELNDVWYNIGHGWNNNSNGWTQVHHGLRQFVGKTGVKFRFHFKGLVQESGFAFDDFEICDKPVPDFTEDLTNKGYFVTFINLSTNMDSCLWDFGDGTTSNLITPPNHSYPNSNPVLVTLHVYNSCGEDSIKKYVHPKFVGINSSDLNQIVQIFPNPVNDFLSVNISDISGEVKIELQNIQGKILAERKIEVVNSCVTEFQLGQFPAGIYLIKIITEKGIIYRKIVKY